MPGNISLLLILWQIPQDVIVKFFSWFESDDAVYLSMEYLPLGDLSKYIPTSDISEQNAKHIASDILEALQFIHDEGFTHRDIKPQVSNLNPPFLRGISLVIHYFEAESCKMFWC